MTLEAEPVSPGEALSGKLSGKLIQVYGDCSPHSNRSLVNRLTN